MSKSSSKLKSKRSSSDVRHNSSRGIDEKITTPRNADKYDGQSNLSLMNDSSGNDTTITPRGMVSYNLLTDLCVCSPLLDLQGNIDTQLGRGLGSSTVLFLVINKHFFDLKVNSFM